MSKRILLSGAEARKRLLAGVNKATDIIKDTLGPKAKSFIFPSENRAPKVEDDGRWIVANIKLDDPIEQLGVDTLVEIASQSDDLVGDGTTTSMVLARAIIQEAFSRMDNEMSVLSSDVHGIDLYNEINKECEGVVEELKRIAKSVKTKKELYSVALTSFNDPEMAELIADMVYKVGVDGHIAVYEGLGRETEVEINDGMKFYAGYADFEMATTNDKKGLYEDYRVLITNHDIVSIREIIPLIESVVENKDRGLVLFAPKFSTLAIREINGTNNAQKANRLPFRIMGIKYPSLTYDQNEDTAIYCGAKFINKQNNENLDGVLLEDLGFASRILVDQDTCMITGGAGTKEAINARIEKIKAQQKSETVDFLKKKLDRRIAALKGKIGIIKVAEDTTIHGLFKKHKIDDATQATQAALRGGVVKGGGLALVEASKTLPDTSLLKKALQEPYNLIKKSGITEIADNVIDPLQVVVSSLMNACSAAGVFITVNAATADESETAELERVFEKVLGKFFKPREGETEWARLEKEHVPVRRHE